MAYISFLHVADLYLDSALSASFPSQDDVTKNVQNAPFEALENLIALCEKKRPHFVLIAGDMYNSENVSLKARFALASFYEKLANLSIPVYYAHGRHNPLTAKAKKETASFKELAVPAYLENVYNFSDTWECFSFADDVKIYGISHSKHQESRNLAELFENHGQTLDKNCLNIGVFHTSLMGSTSLHALQNEELTSTFLAPYFEAYDEVFDLSTYAKSLNNSSTIDYTPENTEKILLQEAEQDNFANSNLQSKKLSRKLALENLKEDAFLQDQSASSVFIAPELKHASKNQKSFKTPKPKKSELYAPCSLEDLEKIGIDYWALGYIHKAQTLMKTPTISYAGSMQGLHAHETGAHGCLFVEIDKKENFFTTPKTSFYSLAPVEWHELTVYLPDCTSQVQDWNDKKSINLDEFWQAKLQHTIHEEQKEERGTYSENLSNEDRQSLLQFILIVQKNILQALQEYLQEVWIGQKCKTVLFRIVLHGQSEFSSFLQEKEVQIDLCRMLEKIINTPHSQSNDTVQNAFWTNIEKFAQRSEQLSVYFKDIKPYVRPLFDFESALNRDDILGEVLRVSHNLRNNDKMLRSMEKQASDLLRTKIAKFTSNLYDNSTVSTFLEQKNFMDIIDKAEEICIDVFEPEQK